MQQTRDPASALDAARRRAGRPLQDLRGFFGTAHGRWLLAILVVALILRLGMIGYLQPNPRDGRFDDTVWYDGAAQHLAAGDGYVNPYTEAPTAKWPVGYPLTLAALYKATDSSLTAARLLNVVLGVAAVAGTYVLGALVLDRRAGLVGAGLMALFPSHILFTPLIMSEVYYTALLVAGLALTAAWTLGPSPGRWYAFVVLGALLAFASMVRGEALLFVGVPVLLWALFYRRPWRGLASRVGFTAVGVVLVLTPWTARNWMTMDSFIVGTTGAGGVLYQSHYAASEGSGSLERQVELQSRFDDLPPKEQEIEVNRVGTEESLRFMLTHPLVELRLTGKRLFHLYKHDHDPVTWIHGVGNTPMGPLEIERLETLADGYYFMVLGLALAGLPLTLRPRSPGRLLLLLTVVYYTVLFGVLFNGIPRYHTPLVPVFSLLAAPTILAVLDRRRAEKAGSAGPEAA